MSEATTGAHVGDSDVLDDEFDELGDELVDPDLLRPAPETWHRRTTIEMIVSVILGLVASFVLSIEAWELAANPDAVFSCDINSAISCGTVARAWQAHLLSFPNAFLGIFFETIVLTISVSMLLGVRFPRLIMLGAEALYTIGVENPRTGNELVATMAAALQGRLVVTITPATGMAAWSNA